MFVLDTDHLVIAQERHEPYSSRLQARLTAIKPSDVFLTVVSTHEQMLGANQFIFQAKKNG